MGIGQLLFSFAGRINRGKFWLGYVISILLVMVLFAAIAMLVPWDQLFVLGADGQPILDAEGNPQINPEVEGLALPIVLCGLAFLLSAYMSFALMVKRCHDRGKSGWWSLVALIPVVGFIWFIVDLGVMEGEEGPNRWGPNPLGPQAATS
jgi:uncharacterized membrane protein YhaH (DUF805 family)